MKMRNQVWAWLGVCALSIYVLACRPSFSPDGKQLVFPSCDEESKQTVIWLYERGRQKPEPLLVLPWRDEAVVASAVWSGDGKHVIVAWTEAEAAPGTIAVLPIAKRGPVRVYPLPEGVVTAGGLLHPPIVAGSELFLGGKALSRVNWETGQHHAELLPGNASVTQGETEIILLSQAGRLYYLLGQDEVAEVGTVDPETLARHKLFEWADVPEKWEGFPAISRDGSCLAVGFDEEETSGIGIYRGRDLEKRLAVGTTNAPLKLGNLLWSADEQTVYAAAIRSSSASEAGEATELAFVEIPLDGGQLRVLPLCSLKKNDTALACFQIALSPDGKSVAVSTAFDPGSPTVSPDRALYLIDLTKAKRKVRKVVLPLPKATLATPAEE